ncbi:MAG: Gx transporter family protein [Lachnospiraceae bacterium]|nr:Gx transporter family protein [Lachnospiraceae bacterium]
MMQSHIKSINKVAYLGVLLAFSLILSYLDSLLMFFSSIPGVKLGLANLSVIVCLYLIDYKYAFILSILKAVLSSLLFGSAFSMIYSLGGAFLSIFFMIIFYKINIIHIITVSIIGGVFHNIGQLLVAIFILKDTSILYYFPILMISGLLTGAILGFVASIVNPYIKKIISIGGNL